MLGAMSEPPRLQFPCRYPIKVMVRARAGIRAELDAIVARLAGPLAGEDVSERASAQNNFTGITYSIQARDAEHIAALFAELQVIEGVLMVL